jgi:hypothetical protein
MSKFYRLSFLTLSFIVLLLIGYQIKGNIAFVFDDFWFTSGLLLLILLSLIDQPHFSKDSNIFVNSIAAGISLLLVEGNNRDFIFWVFTYVTLYLLISSYALMWLRHRPLMEELKYIQIISRINRQFGRPESLFSAFF